MDAKDLRIETALGERNDGSKYSQSGVALQCHRNKSYQDIGSNPLAKAEATVRPFAVIGPDRVVPPPASNDAYLKKASVDLWPSPDNLYSRPPEYPHKPLNNVNPSRNISPRQTFQENMQRIMVPPTYSAVKPTDESNLNHAQDLNAAFSKHKQTLAPEAKYCDVPYAVNLLSNEHKNVKETEMCVPSANSPLTGTMPHGWPPSGVNLHTPRAYGTHDVYQYPQYPSCAGPRQTNMPLARPHRTYQEEASYVYADSYYQDGSVRFKPYPSVKERFPQARYDYISNYPNPFHPPPPYVQHKYDIPSTRPHPYPVYPHLKYLDNRVPDANIEGYQRANQQSINYNMQFRNQVIHPTYVPAQGNAQSKVPYQPDTPKSSNKLSFDNNKAYVDYENAKAKYALPESYFVNEMARVHQVQKPVAIPNYLSPGLHPAPMQQYHRKDNMPMKAYEFKPHYRHFEHPVGFNPSGHHTPQFSPSTLAISPTDSNTSNGTSQEDCGYISQSSATSVRSVDSGMSSRLHNEYYRRYDYRFRPPVGNPQMLQKSDLNPNNTKENNKIDVRQFLSMWSEGDEDNSTTSNSKEISPKIQPDPNNYIRSHESAKSHNELYVLGLVNVPNEELAKYEHIQKVSKLPENIKGYNSIELLNQFEEVIESSNMNSFKSSTSKDFFMQDRKNAIKHLVEALPRPVSPLDVEAKISQSVIHKEVGCNFEIKPCSPKMLNVEIAAPVQNILGERAIEKISNPLTNKSKSPLSMRIDGNTACNQIQRQESMHTTYENPSCKMVGSPFAANNMESVKTNYSLQDLETSSGVCLASLPRLDNEIELNFLEVNQQFINANKGDCNLLEKHSQELTEDDMKFTTSGDNDKVKYDSEKYINTSVNEVSKTELTKLSKYRKSKPNGLEFSEDESNANAIRTDSVIIENPDNVRRIEENKEKVALHGKLDEEENTPMNLTSQGSSREESSARNSPKHETHIMECALDFSLSRSEEGLPIINGNDDKLIKNDVSNEPSKSIIVINAPKAISGCQIKLKDDDTLSGIEQNAVSPENPEKTDNNITKQEETYLTCDNADKKIGEKDFDKNEKNSVDKSTSTNVIVNHKLKNKNKRSKAKTNIQELRPTNQNGVGSLNNKYNLKRKEETSSLENFGTHENSSHMFDTKRFKQEPNNTKTVIHNILSDDYEQFEVANLNICKDEVNKTKSATNNLNHNNMLSESNIFEEKFLNDEVMVQNCAKLTNSPAAKVNISEKDYIKKSISDYDEEINDTTLLICGQGEVLKSTVEIGQANKYYNDLISESELFVDKTYCIDAVNQSPSNSFVHEEIVVPDNIKISGISKERDLDRVEKKTDTKKNQNNQVLDDINIVEPDSGTTRYQDNIKISGISKERDLDRVEKKTDTKKKQNNQVLDDINIVEPDSGTTRYQNNCHKSLLSETNKKNDIGYDELDKDLFEDVVSKYSAEVIASECEEKETENYHMKDCETTIRTNFPSDETNIVERITGIDGIEHHRTVPVLIDAGLLVDKKCSIDSGYQSHKNSFVENDDSIIEVPENSNEDSVFVDSGSNQITSNSCIENASTSKDIQSVSKRSIQKSNSSSLVNTLVNKTSEDLNFKNKIEIPPKTSQSSDLYDSVDAEMQILFEQPNEEIISENIDMDMVNNANICDTNFNLETENKKNNKELDIAPKISYSNKEYVDVADEQIQLNTQKELNITEKIQVEFKIDGACKENEILGSILNVQTKVEISIIALDHDDHIKKENNILEMDETSPKSCKEYESDTEVCNTLHIKKYCDYRGIKLYSPWIQKLMFHNEGKIFKTQCLENMCETKLQSDDIEVNALRKPNTDNIINEATPHDANYNVHCEGKTELIQDVDLRIDVECETKNSESNTNNSIESCNDESSPDFSSSMDHIKNFDVVHSQGNALKINPCESNLTEKENKPESENECIECDQNDLIDAQEISFNYPNNSIISQITENIFNSNNSMLELKCEDNNFDSNKFGVTNIDRSPINNSRSLKRSFSDSALNTRVNRDNNNLQGFGNMHYAWTTKRNKVSEFENFMPNNRRNSVNIEENVSFCILIDDNCIITEENEEKICIAELQEDYMTEIDAGNDVDNNRSLKELYASSHELNVAGSEILECEEENPVHESWVEDIGCVETVYNDEVAENVVISAPSSPTDSVSKYEHDESGVYSDSSTTCSHTDKVKFMFKDKMSYEDAQVVDTLYRTPHMDIMNKTLLYGDKNIESDNTLTDPHQENILLESDDWKPSPTHTADYIDTAQASNDFRLETPENKENMFVKELSPLRRIDDYLDVSSAENEIDEQTLPHVLELDKTTQDSTVHSCESSLDNVFDYKLKDASMSTISSTSYTTSSSPEVSSTTSEEKNSSILLKITNLNGSRVSQINEIETNNRPRCKFTEKKEYSTSNLNFPNRPLITKAAQKYIPPIKESIRDLKVKISLPQQSLLKLKQLKLSRSELKRRKQPNVIPIIAKKPKPNFDDVLKSIDEIQIKRHKEKSKKTKTVVPKVVIKKNENGSHYASIPKKDMFNPDLTGRKWQPWVFLEKNHFIDKMAIKNKTRAIYSHRKKNYVLAENFKKYKSVSTTKFIISQPKTPGQLKYTIRLKHTY